MEEVKFSTQVGVKDMYRFMMRHAYVGVAGIINLVISGGALVLFLLGFGGGVAFNNAMLLLIAALFTIINPILLFYKAAKQVKLTPMFQKPLDFLVNKEGILVSQGEEQLLIQWVDIRKVVETSSAIYLYLSLTRAYIFPKESYASVSTGLKTYFKECVDAKALKLK